MNLRALANLATQAVNPNVTVNVNVSAGYQTNAAGKQIPTYYAPLPVIIQVQALTRKDIDHLASLNISGVTRAIYCNQPLQPITGVNRKAQSGGDLLDMQDGRWLVTATLEEWTTGGWAKLALTQQIDTGDLALVPGRPLWVVEDWQGDVP